MGKKVKKRLDSYGQNVLRSNINNRGYMSKLKHFNPMALREKYSSNNTNYSGFWMGDLDSRKTSIFDDDEVEVKRGVDHIALASYRRAISNFVSIVTGDSSIPVRFQTNNDSYTDGKVVTIGSKLDDKNFDSTVGLALHEGSHIKLSDFVLLKNLEFEIRHDVYELGKGAGYSRYDVMGHVKNMLNYVEDRRIDYYVFTTSPGYKGYYTSMYDKYFHSKVIDKAVLSDEHTSISWDSYLFRILNFTNKNRRLDVLPKLDKIYNLIFKDMGGIKSMQSTSEALEVAQEVVYTIYKLLPDAVSDDKTGEVKPASEISDGDKMSNGGSVSDSKVDEIKKLIENGEMKSGSGGEVVELTDNQKKQLANAIEKQKKFINGESPKTGKLSKKDEGIVKSMEEAGVELKNVGDGLTKEQYDYESGSYKPVAVKGVKCIYVNKLTDGMFDDYVFPALMSTNFRDRNRTDLRDYYLRVMEHNKVPINEGIALGKKLGRKLQVRGESRDTKWTRLDSGKIDKRLISELGFGNQRVFNTTFVEKFSDAFLHISVDASGSMSGDKWDKTMTSVVAICQAASMIQNVDVVVSFRTTHEAARGTRGNSNYMPLIAVGYDSRVDKMSKIKRHFAFIRPGGTTPEGLCFEAILKDIIPTSNDRDSYFLNFSDGMPMFSGGGVDYYYGDALNHTKKMVNKIRGMGVNVLSYFIGDTYDRDRYVQDFKTMYGKDASFINVTNVMEVAKTMNKMFLTK